MAGRSRGCQGIGSGDCPFDFRTEIIPAACNPTGFLGTAAYNFLFGRVTKGNGRSACVEVRVERNPERRDLTRRPKAISAFWSSGISKETLSHGVRVSVTRTE